MNGKRIPDYKRALIRQDIELYLAGKITLKEIAKKYDTTEHAVRNIELDMVTNMIAEHMNKK